ncbi:unnamed protein product [Cylindrotheca closterium]|uniref:PsbP C-terminal domain-containing protein n=1 Tax=Cylindrotheca closterium TaxID=2856 RepID=A0AAD2CGH3_9STRA|nr:unnamed protein product [Cylindrotheca closterium]
MKTIGEILLVAVCLQSSLAFQAPVTNTASFSRLSPPTSTSRHVSNDDKQVVSPISEAANNDDSNTPSAAPSSSSSSSSSPAATEPQEFRRVVDTRPPPTADQMMLALGTNPRRLLLGNLSAAGIALAGNFLGVTSKLLTAVPEEVVEKTSLDTYYPRGDFKRCRSRGYTFVIPKEWVADTFVELAKAQRRIQPLDYTMSGPGSSRQQQQQQPNTLPDAAYGPAGRLNSKGVSESGDTNVSVIVNNGLKGFSLMGTLGTPQNAAEFLLSRSIAPEGSGRVATLLNSFEDKDRNAYQFEYILDRGSRGPPLRNIAVIAGSTKGDAFYTLTVVAPATQWEKEAVSTKLRKIASSFHLTV